ncbi:MAG: cytochrome C biosynthesis protein, partial [Flavobacterium sp.]|nr:cytochrome C biosynthesis protein [Flavobacterium sp.]
MKNTFFYISIFVLLFNSPSLFAQIPKDTLALAENKFEDSFYESLKQKGIENYDKAIESLEKCKDLQPQNAIIYYELGKNYLSQKKYKD